MSWDSAVLGLILALSVHQQAEAQEPSYANTPPIGQGLEAADVRRPGSNAPDSAECQDLASEAQDLSFHGERTRNCIKFVK